MSGPEIKARLSLDSSQFSAGIDGANKKAAKIFGKGFGVGKTGFMAFDAISTAIEESNGSFKQFSKNMAATGAMAAGVIGIAKAWEFLSNTIKEVDANLKDFNAKGKFGTFLWTLGIGGLEIDKAKRQEAADNQKQDAIARAAKAIKGPDAEERVLRWMRANNVGQNEDVRIAERLRMEQGVDDRQKQREQIMGAGSRSLGLNVGLGNGVVDYFRSVADNTLETVNLLTQVRDNLIVGGVPARAG
jgi:hypothetical protein